MVKLKKFLTKYKIFIEAFFLFTNLIISISMFIIAINSNKQSELSNKLALWQTEPNFSASINHHNNTTAGILIENSNLDSLHKNYTSNLEVYISIENKKKSKLTLIPISDFSNVIINTNKKHGTIETYIGTTHNYKVFSDLISSYIASSYYNPDFEISLKAFVTINYINILNEKIDIFLDVYSHKIITEKEYFSFKKLILKDINFSFYFLNGEKIISQLSPYLK